MADKSHFRLQSNSYAHGPQLFVSDRLGITRSGLVKQSRLVAIVKAQCCVGMLTSGQSEINTLQAHLSFLSSHHGNILLWCRTLPLHQTASVTDEFKMHSSVGRLSML